MICERCGVMNQENAFYCEDCGEAIEKKRIETKQCQICHREHGAGAKYCATYGYNIEKWLGEKNKFEREKQEVIGGRIKEGILFSFLTAWVVIAIFSVVSVISMASMAPSGLTLIGWVMWLIEIVNIVLSLLCCAKFSAYFNKIDNYWAEIWRKRTDKLKAV